MAVRPWKSGSSRSTLQTVRTTEDRARRNVRLLHAQDHCAVDTDCNRTHSAQWHGMDHECEPTNDPSETMPERALRPPASDRAPSATVMVGCGSGGVHEERLRCRWGHPNEVDRTSWAGPFVPPARSAAGPASQSVSSRRVSKRGERDAGDSSAGLINESSRRGPTAEPYRYGVWRFCRLE